LTIVNVLVAAIRFHTSGSWDETDKADKMDKATLG